MAGNSTSDHGATVKGLAVRTVFGQSVPMKRFLCLAAVFGVAVACFSALAAKPASFDDVATQALLAMEKRAHDLRITGVAMVAFSEGARVTAWSSKMRVLGAFTKEGKAPDPRANLLAVAYSKACEMAETGKNSGLADRSVYAGETGWKGGVTKQTKRGFVFAAFSGGPSEDDVKISQAGLAVLERL